MNPDGSSLRVMRFVSALLVALTLGLAFAHVLEIPGKLRLDGASWLTVQHNLYVAFGVVGAAIEILAILSTWMLLLLVRGERRAFAWTLAAALLATAALIEWALVVAPMNTALDRWNAATLPPDWRSVRDRWEAGHAIHALLFGLAFSALIVAMLGKPRRAAS
jgi:hypothetical protein